MSFPLLGLTVVNKHVCAITWRVLLNSYQNSYLETLLFCVTPIFLKMLNLRTQKITRQMNLKSFASGTTSKMASFNWTRTYSFNPLIAKIHIQILQTDLQTFSTRISWEHFTKIKAFSIKWSVLLPVSLKTFSFDYVSLLGENRCCSVLVHV